MTKVADISAGQSGGVFATVVQASAGGNATIASADFLQSAEYHRAGPDLILEGPDGSRILIQDFFTQQPPPNLVSADGCATIDGGLATTLAGSSAPGQYAQAAGSAAQHAIGTVSVQNGTVTVKHADGSHTVLHKGDPVFPDDVIETGQGSAIGVTFEDGTTFSLGSAGRMVLDDLTYDPDTHTGSGNIAVLKGAFTFVSGQIPKTAPDALTIKTPAMTVGIRGTAGAGNTQTVVLLAERGGVAGELIITTPSGQTLTVNVPGLAASVSPSGSLLSVQMSPAQVQALAGNSLGALPNPGNLSPTYNPGNQNQDQPYSPPPQPAPTFPPQTIREVQTAVELALAMQTTVRQETAAQIAITQLLADAKAAVSQAVQAAVDNVTNQLDARDAARSAAEAAAVAEVQRIIALIRAKQELAHAAYLQSESALTTGDLDTLIGQIQNALNDGDPATDDIASLYAQAQAATHNIGAAVSALATATSLKTAAETDLALAQLHRDALADPTNVNAATAWRNNSAITDKIAKVDTAEEAQDAQESKRLTSEQATADAAAARNTARAPLIQEAATAAVRDVQLQTWAEAKVGLAKAIDDYITAYGQSAHASDWYSIDSTVNTALNDYKNALNTYLSTHPGQSTKDAVLDSTVAAKLTTLLAEVNDTSVTSDIADNEYAQSVKLWIEAETSIKADYDNAIDAYTAAHAAAEAARTAVTTAETAATNAAADYADALTDASAAAVVAAVAIRTEMYDATAAQLQVESMMSAAMQSVLIDMGSAGDTTTGTVLGDVHVAAQKAAAALAAATAGSLDSVAADAARDLVQTAVNDITTRLSEIDAAIGGAGHPSDFTAYNAKDLSDDLPASLSQADATAQALAHQVMAKAAADYDKLVAIRADLIQQQALAQSYLEQANQAVTKAEDYEALANAASAADAALAVTKADAAVTSANSARDAADAAARQLDGNTGNNAGAVDVANVIATRVTTLTTGAKPLDAMNSNLGGAQTSFDAIKALALALGNSALTAKITAAEAALNTAATRMGSANSLVDGAAAQVAAKSSAASTAAQAAADAANAAHTADAQTAIYKAAADAGGSAAAVAAAAQAAAEAAKTAVSQATIASQQATLAAQQVQALATYQNTMDSAVATATTAVKSAVETVNWAGALYNAVSSRDAATLAVNSAASTTDAADNKAAMTADLANLTAASGAWSQLAAWNSSYAGNTADKEAAATIAAAYNRALAAKNSMDSAFTDATGQAGSAQGQLELAQSKTAAALSATSLTDALRLAAEAQNAAAEAQRLAAIVATDRTQSDTAKAIIEKAYADAQAAVATLSIATQMQAYANTAQARLTDVQAEHAQLVQDLATAQNKATAITAQMNVATPDISAAEAAKGLAQDAADDAAIQKAAAQTAYNLAKAAADNATTYYNSLNSTDKSSVVTAYYNQAVKAAADAKALLDDAGLKLTATQNAAATATNDYNTLYANQADATALRIAAIDAATAKALDAKTVTEARATEAASLYTATSTSVSANLAAASALGSDMASYVTLKGANATIAAWQNSLDDLTSSISSAMTKLSGLKNSIDTAKSGATSAYNDVHDNLDPLTTPSSGNVTTAQTDAELASAKANLALNLRAAMDQQIALINDKLAQVAVLRAQFQSLANDAPVLTSTTAITLAAIPEDVGTGTANGGVTVTSLVSSRATDAETASTSLGMALTGVDTASGGKWQYFNGTTWTDVPANLNSAHALLLKSSDKLRFVPDANWNSQEGGHSAPTITFRAWDGTDGAAYSQVNLNSGTAVGGFTGFSSGTLTASLPVAAVNDLPVLSGGIEKSGAEDGVISFTANDFSSHYSDVETTTPASIKVLTLPANGTLKLNGVTVAANQVIAYADLSKLTFTPNANWNGSANFQWSASDGTAFSATASSVSLTVTAVNDAPIVTGLGNAVTVAANGTIVAAFAATAAVTDVDSSVFSALTITLSGGLPGDVLDLDPGASSSFGIEYTNLYYYDSDHQWGDHGSHIVISGDSITITFQSGKEPPAALINELLHCVQFSSTSDVGGARTLTVTTTDNLGAISTAASRTLTVNTPPELVVSSSHLNDGITFSQTGYAASAEGTLVNTRIDDLTVEIRFNWSHQSSGQEQTLFYNGDSSSSGYGLTIVNGEFALQLGGVGTFATGISVPTSGWHHVALVREDGTWGLYLDGAKTAYEATTEPNAIAGGRTIIGNASNLATGFLGSIDDVAVWSEARSAAQIALDQSGIVDVRNLDGHWNGSITAGTLTDLTNHAHNLDVASSATYTPVLASDRADNLTVEIAFSWSGNGSGTQTLFYNGASETGGYGVALKNGTLFVLTDGPDQVDTGIAVSPGNNHTVALVRDGGTWKLYLDGTDQGINVSLTPSPLSGGHTVIGNDDLLATPFLGSITTVALWNSVRSESEISGDFSSISPAADGLVAHWTGDSQTGPMADSSDNHIEVAATAPFETLLGLSTSKGTATTFTLTTSEDPNATITILTQPTHGTITVSGHTYTYTPAAGYIGSDNFTISTADPLGATQTYGLSVMVQDVNTAPTSSAVPTITAPLAELVTVDLSTYFHDADSTDHLIYSAPTGMPNWLTLDPQTGILSGSPPAGDNSATFTVLAIDRAGQSTSQTITVATPELTLAGVSTPNSALSFDGNDTAQSKVTGMTAASGTVELWLQVADWQSAGEQYILGNAVPPDAAGSVILSLSSSGLVLHYGGTSSAEAITLSGPTTGASFLDGSSHHVAFSWASSGGQSVVTLYVDGAQVATTTTSLSLDTATLDTWRLGTGTDNPMAGLDGSVDNLRLWSDVRSGGEILGNYQLTHPVSADHLVADWRMDNQTETGDIVDASGNQNVLNLSPDDTNPTRLNQPEQGLGLNGDSANYVQLAGGTITELMTIEAWVKPNQLQPGDSGFTTPTDFSPIYSVGSPGTEGYLAVGYSDTGLLTLRYFHDGENYNVQQNSGHLTADTWNHVAVVFGSSEAGTSVTLYVDGTSCGGSDIPTLTASSVGEAYVGHVANGNSLDGSIADLRIYDHARTDLDIRQDMNSRLNGDEYGLLLGLSFGQSYQNNSVTYFQTEHGGDTPTFTSAWLEGTGSVVHSLGTAFDTTLTVQEDTSVTARIVAQDLISSHTLSYAVTANGQPSHGWVDIQGDGTLTYHPDENYVGADSFTLQVTDGHGKTATKIISVDVTAVDDTVAAKPPPSTDFGALSLHGDTAITVAGGLNTGSGPVTYETWMRYDPGIGGTQTILAAGNGSNSVTLTMGSNGALIFNLGGEQVSASLEGNWGGWHHIAATAETSASGVTTLILYVDGRAASSYSGAFTYSVSGGGATLGASQGGSDYLHGKLSDIRVYTEARSMAEVQSDMAGNTSGGTSTLVARWTCAEDNGTTLADSGTTATHTGTITGSHYDWDNRVVAVTTSSTPMNIGGLSLYDPDTVAGGTSNAPDELRVVLNADHGNITIANTDGLTYVETNGSHCVTLMGSLSALNTVLAHATYTPDTGFTGDDGIKVTVTEQIYPQTRVDGGTLPIFVLAAPTTNDDILMGSPGVDIIDGLAGNDVLWGRDGNDTLIGGTGDDQLHGEQDNDVLLGGDGTDTLDGGEGADTLTGGAGSDTIIVEGNDIVVYSNPTDSVGSAMDSISNFDASTSIHFEGLVGITYDPAYTLADIGPNTPSDDLPACISFIDTMGPDNRLYFFEASGNGYLYVKGGAYDGTVVELLGVTTAPTASQIRMANIVSGTAGNDTLVGTAGGDVISGLGGADTLTGGAGADNFSYTTHTDSPASAMDVITDFNAAQGDTITVTTANGMGYSGTAYGSVQATVASTISTILADSTTADQVVYFSQGGNGYLVFHGSSTYAAANGTVIRLDGVTTPPPNSAITGLLTQQGTSAPDVLIGTNGADFIGGGDGRDSIQGGDGKDTLVGASGGDVLTGGDNADVFRYDGSGQSTLPQLDTITDFASGVDRILFRGISGVSYDGIGYGGVGASLTATLATIQADEGISNRVVFFTMAGDGYLYVKASGNTYDGTLIRLAQITAPPQLQDLPGVTLQAAVNATGTGSGTLSGSWTEDILTGASGQTLYGLDGTDTLVGGANGVLVGGMSADSLSGGTGTTYLYTSADESSASQGADVIVFLAGQKIVFQGMAGITYNDSYGDVTDLQTAINDINSNTDIDNQMVFFTWDGNGYLYVKGNGTGGTFHDTLIKLEGQTSAPDISALVGVSPTAMVLDNTDNSEDIGGDAIQIIDAGEGNDTLNTHEGNDTLIGGAGTDTLTGGAGRDLFIYNDKTESTQDSPDRILDFDVTSDRVQFTGMAGMSYSGKVTATNGSGSLASAIAGITASDEVVFFVYQGDGYLYVNGAGSGTDFNGSLIRLVGMTTAPTLGSILIGDSLMAGNDLANTLYGSNGDDTLVGLNGADTLTGNSGNDTLIGGDGDDYMEGGLGDDVFIADAGSDTILADSDNDTLTITDSRAVTDIYRNGSDLVFETATGTATVRGQFDANFAGISSVTLKLSDSSGSTDTYTVVPPGGPGTSGRDLIVGDTGDDVMAGGNGNDIILGSYGDDTLFGGAGMDFLRGDAGADILIGGMERDKLTGGTGSDQFRFLSAADSNLGEWDLITDFTPGVDRLDLVGLGGLSGLTLRSLTGFEPTSENVINNIAGNAGIPENSICTWIWGGNTYVCVKAAGTPMDTFFVELRGTTTALTSSDILQLQTMTDTGTAKLWDGDGGGDHSWTTAANWGTDTLPDSNSNVVINGATVEHASPDTVYIRNLTATNSTLNITSGSLNLARASVMDANSSLSLSGSGEVTGKGKLSLAGNLTWSGGTLSSGQGVFVSGTTIITGASSHILGSVLALAGTSTLNGTAIVGNGELLNAGTMTVTSSAYVQTEFANSGQITIASDAGHSAVALSIGSDLMNSGTITLDARDGLADVVTLALSNGAGLFLGDGSTLIAAADGGGSGHVVQGGRIELDGGTIIAHDMMSLNTGTEDFFISDGILSVDAGKTLSIDLSNGGSLVLDPTGQGLIVDGGGAVLVTGFGNGVWGGGSVSVLDGSSLSLAGSLTLGDDMRLNLSVGDDKESSLALSGSLALGGTLHAVADGVSAESEYTLMTYDSVAGHFAQLTGLDTIGGGLLLDPTLGASTLTMTGRAANHGSTSGDDIFAGIPGGADYLLLGSGNDDVQVGSGADVVFGQAGNDTIGISGTDFHLLDGGDGTDTLRFDGASGSVLDLSSVGGFLQNLEKISLDATGNQDLQISRDTILGMTGNSVNALTNSEHTMVVTGTAEDALDLSGGTWTLSASNASISGDANSYSVYSSTEGGKTVSVFVDSHITLSHS